MDIILLVVKEVDDDYGDANEIEPLPKVGKVLIPTKHIHLENFNHQ